jgi:hypothetical protein
MKKEHESWVDHNLGERNRAEEFHYVPDPAYERFCDHRLIHIWKYPKAHIICCSYGSNPVEIVSGIWKASGIAFYRFPGANLEKAPEYIINISEAEPEVEYRCDAGALEVTQYTYDPRIEGFTPFITMRFEHDRPLEYKLMTLRLAPETEPIDAVLGHLRLPKGSANFGTIEENLYRFRNIGLSIPRQALKWTHELWGAWWCDGAGAETLRDIEKQFEIIIEAEKVE